MHQFEMLHEDCEMIITLCSSDCSTSWTNAMKPQSDISMFRLSKVFSLILGQEGVTGLRCVLVSRVGGPSEVECC